MKFYVRTYGCQMNVADSNEMGRHLKARGLVETQDPDEASVFLVNTCTVRQHAEDRAFSEVGRLRRWKAKHPEAAKHLEVDDVLIDSMRGRSSTWTRIRVNLRHVPEALRPSQETPDPDDDPTREWRSRRNHERTPKI